MENEPIPVSLALRAVERAIRETEGFGTDIGCCYNCSLARAGFRGTLVMLKRQISMIAVLDATFSSHPAHAAVAPIIAHYDRVSPRTE